MGFAATPPDARLRRASHPSHVAREVLLQAVEGEAADDLGEALGEGGRADPDHEQHDGPARVADRPERDEHLERAHDEEHPPELVFMSAGERGDDLERPVEEQVPGEDHGEGDERLFGPPEGEDPGDDRRPAEEQVQPAPVLDHQRGHQLAHGDEEEEDSGVDRHRPHGRDLAPGAQDDEAEDDPERAGDEVHPPGAALGLQHHVGVARYDHRSRSLRLGLVRTL